MGDGTASRAAGVRLKKMRGSDLRCDMNRTFIHFFSFWPSETSRELRVLLEEEECAALSFVLFGGPAWR